MAAYGGGRGPGFGFSICRKGEQDLGIYLGPSKSETFNESMSYKKNLPLWEDVTLRLGGKRSP